MNNINVYDVRVLPGDSAFLIDNGKNAVLYDSGFGFTGYAIADKIKGVLKNRKLDYIFLTHSHYDHALASAYIKRIYPDAEIVAGEYAATIFQKPGAKSTMRELDKKFALKNNITDYDDLADELKADITVDDGSEIYVGDMKFKAIHLPGHTKCSFGFLNEDEKFLLGCETLGVYGGDNVVIPSYLVGYKMTLDSIEKIKDYDINAILTPHYGILRTEQAERYISQGYKSAKETGEEIAQMISCGASDEQVLMFFKNKFYNHYVKTIYPEDAMELNTKIMVELIKKELF